jgi:hypothetical protein
MRIYHNMGAPAPSKPSAAAKLVPVIGGFVLFSVAAVFDHRLAMVMAVGAIGFAVISMIVALTRKH